ncbi:porin [Paraburkholderia silviterrae]|uniref:Porin n=1 Tax=Paraburkholderia silviterrae TaxID=2528715 RepID=A0A4V2ZY56_9BURK|nr:porin [Paraburkholderia silviterrae]TDG18276.1 porin [Paraburkholderia silviterrae]
MAARPSRFEDVAQTLNTPYLGQAVFDNYEANVQYQFTPAFNVGLGYTYTDAPRAKYQQVNLGAQYYLSKRTTLYVIGVYQYASGIDSYGAPAVAQINEVAPSSTPNQLLARAGLLFKFQVTRRARRSLAWPLRWRRCAPPRPSLHLRRG